MWQDKLKEIIYILENSDVNEIEVTFWGKKIRVLKNSPNIAADPSDAISYGKNIKSTSSDDIKNQTTYDINGANILSPMPGVFYSAQSPDKPPYVKEGDTVKTGQVICVVESMKIMNEIESEYDGVIKKIFVNNSDPVEFNQPLYLIEPS
jgi:acetyl-CoA carboxylase biotin carboxyl carrier protein|tara:strand:- start:38 stop:487 length:450 start_codon:yes stop_codon:yes gene_type:complete